MGCLFAFVWSTRKTPPRGWWFQNGGRLDGGAAASNIGTAARARGGRSSGGISKTGREGSMSDRGRTPARPAGDQRAYLGRAGRWLVAALAFVVLAGCEH